MKRWRDGGGFDDDRERRDTVPEAPLAVQALAPRGRARRFVLPAAIGAVALTFVLATVGRFATYFGGAASPTPPTPEAIPTPAPIAWLDTTAAPTPTVAPSPNPDATLPEPTPVRTPAPEVSVGKAYQSFLLTPGQTIDFTITLTNDGNRAISLKPCPTYRIYLVGGTAPSPDRPLNCAAAGPLLLPGASLTFAMVFVVPADAPAGHQLLIWELRSGLRGTVGFDLSIAEAASPAAS